MLPALLVTFLTLPGWTAPIVLFDNLADTGTGLGLVAGNEWQAQQFSTGSSGGFLTQAILSVVEAVPGATIVDIYTSNANEPGTLVGSLLSVGTYSSTAAQHTYSGSVALAASSAYYVVLRATSGSYAWNFANSSSGSGVGFSSRWAQSSNAGASWGGGTVNPNKMSLLLEVPDPGAPELNGSGAPLALSLMAGMLLGLSSRRRVQT